VVTYGSKYEPVAKSYITPLFELPDINVGFWEKLNSFSLILHLYWVSYMVKVLSNEQVIFGELIISVINEISPPPYIPVP